MPEVLSNTSPLQYLFQSSNLDLLRVLYGRVIVPTAVVDDPVTRAALLRLAGE